MDFPDIASGTPVDHRDLLYFAARHSLVVNEAQQQFMSWLGEPFDSWRADFPNGTLTWGSRQMKMQPLGSHSTADDTWLWS